MQSNPSPLLRRAALYYVWVVRIALALPALWLMGVVVSKPPDFALICKAIGVTLILFGGAMMYDAAKRIL